MCYQTSFTSCILDYCNFSISDLKNTIFNEDRMINMSLESAKLKNCKFDECNMQGSNFFKTKLDKIDFTTCQIDGITVGIDDIKGAIVTQYQAVELAKLMGIIIK